MPKKPSPRWNVEVYHHGKKYRGYAVHVNGKVEKECSSTRLVDATIGASDLVHMLNLYHRYGGQYRGVDKIVGKRIPDTTVKEILARSKEATKELMKAHRRIFGKES